MGTEYLICPEESQKALFVSADANAKILMEYTGLDSKIKREQFDFSDVTPLKSLRSLGQRLSQIRKLSKVILAPEAVLNGTQSIELALKKVPSLPLETFA